MTLNSEQQKVIDWLVESGLYQTADEAIDAAIRLLEQRHRKLEALRQDIRAGLESGPGKPIDANTVDEIVSRGQQRLNQRSDPR